MDPVPLFRDLAISLLLGLLVGLQRQRTDPVLAGIRTFPLICLFGTLCGHLSQSFEFVWIVPAGVLGIIAVIVVGNLPALRVPDPGHGVTTEVAMLVMFAVGALVVVGPSIVAAAVTGAVAILLQLKPQMHGFAAKLGEKDMRAILQFVLITFIILPVVPRETYDPMALLRPLAPQADWPELRVLNPHQIWLMVVLVVSISLGGYVSYKLFGEQAGILLGGILGGTISSTATTVSFARRTASAPEGSVAAAIVVLIAGTVTFVRVLLEIAVTAPAFLPVAAGPIGTLLAVSTAQAGLLWLAHRRGSSEMPAQENPSELKAAMLFGAVYASVTLAVAAAKAFLKDAGLYGVAVLSGMMDMDAITLSTSNFVRSGTLDAQVGWQVIVVATLSNLVFKGAVVAAVGARPMFWRVALAYGVLLGTGGAVLAFWPA